MFIINVVGKGVATSGLFFSYHSWQVGLPMFDIRNLKSPLIQNKGYACATGNAWTVWKKWEAARIDNSNG